MYSALTSSPGPSMPFLDVIDLPGATLYTGALISTGLTGSGLTSTGLTAFLTAFLVFFIAMIFNTFLG